MGIVLLTLANVTHSLLSSQQGVNYEIHYHNQTCIKTALKEPFRHIGVPHDAHFLNRMVLGSSSLPGQGLLVNNWNGTVEKTQGNVSRCAAWLLSAGF